MLESQGSLRIHYNMPFPAFFVTTPRILMSTQENRSLARKFERVIKAHPDLGDVSVSVKIEHGQVRLNGRLEKKKQREQVVACVCNMMDSLSGPAGYHIQSKEPALTIKADGTHSLVPESRTMGKKKANRFPSSRKGVVRHVSRRTRANGKPEQAARLHSAIHIKGLSSEERAYFATAQPTISLCE